MLPEETIPIKSSSIRGKFLIIAFPLFLIQILIWPLVWHLILLPKAQPNLQGFRVESSIPSVTLKSIEQNFSPATFFQLDQPDSSLWAYAVWSIPQEGLYLIRVSCDDNGQFIIDNRSIVALRGISALNQGEGYIILNRGQHFLGVRLNNGPGKGWMKIEVLKPGRMVYQPLDIKELSFIRLGNINTWLQTVRWAKIICLAGFIIFGLWGFGFPGLRKKYGLGKSLLVLTSAVLLSLYTVHVHADYLGNFLKTEQVERHLNILQGKAHEIWQYRILADYLVEEIIRIFQELAIPNAVLSGFLFLRFLQGAAIFSVGYLYYRKFGLSTAQALIGISLLAWGMTQSNYGSDLQFSYYFDILLYLCAGSVILIDHPLWIIPITAAAVLNRETSGLIPFMLIASYLSVGSEKLGFFEVTGPRLKIITVATISLALYLIIFFGLRIVIGPRPPFIPYGHPPGFDLLKYNLFSFNTWIQLFGTMGLIPIFALMSFKKWPQTLKVFFWVIIPVWFLIHFFGSVMAESRIVLIPQTLVFIPGALFLLTYSSTLKHNTQ